MLRENGSELVLDLRNGARIGELNAAADDDGGERALVPSSASTSCLMAPTRLFSAPIRFLL